MVWMLKRTLQETGGMRLLGMVALTGLLASGFLGGCGGDSGRDQADSGSGAGGPGTGDAGGDVAPVVRPLPDLEIPTLDELQGVVVKLNTGYMSLRGADYEKSLDYFRQVHELYPEMAMPFVHWAVGLAASGDATEAFRALQKAADLGFKDIYMVMDDPIMDEVMQLPEWPAFEERLRKAHAEARPANLATYRRFDPAGEPSFDSFEALKQHYDSVKTHRSRLVMLHPADEVQLLLWDALNHKMAGLEKRRDKVAGPDERARITSEIMTTAMEYENSNQTPWLRSTLEMIDRVSGEFLEQFAQDSLVSSEVTYVRNRALWYGQKPREDEQLTEPLVTTGIDLLTATDEQYPGTQGALMGLMDALTLAGTYHGLGSPETEPLVRRIQAGYATHPTLRKLGYQFQPHVLALDGIPSFTVTDLDGREWTSHGNDGQVVLFDFWATWCAPCRQEIPTLVKLYEQYHDQGFEIIGISLDKAQIMTEQDLLQFAEEHGMEWPLVYDGKEWGSPAVRACGVSAIPFPILLGRDGSVVAAAETATGKALTAKLKELFADQ